MSVYKCMNIKCIFKILRSGAGQLVNHTTTINKIMRIYIDNTQY